MDIFIKGNLDHEAYDKYEEKLKMKIRVAHGTDFKGYILKCLQQVFMDSRGRNPKEDKELLDLINEYQFSLFINVT